jgi:hypothetical protein
VEFFLNKTMVNAREREGEGGKGVYL